MTNSDQCPECGAGFYVGPDEDGFGSSEREELPCECGDRVFCQACIEERCLVCRQVLCESCGGSDLEGERFCSAHLARPIALKVAA
jgi:hypothetical protein